MPRFFGVFSWLWLDSASNLAPELWLELAIFQPDLAIFSKSVIRQYSGFNFSHYDLPFPTRCCIPYVKSGLYQLVIHVKGIRVRALHCVGAVADTLWSVHSFP